MMLQKNKNQLPIHVVNMTQVQIFKRLMLKMNKNSKKYMYIFFSKLKINT